MFRNGRWTQGANADALYRALRSLAALDVFEEVPGGREPTEAEFHRCSRVPASN